MSLIDHSNANRLLCRITESENPLSFWSVRRTQANNARPAEIGLSYLLQLSSGFVPFLKRSQKNHERRGSPSVGEKKLEQQLQVIQSRKMSVAMPTVQ